MKRLTWEQYFLGLVELSALRSEDPNTKVGAVIVNNKNRIIGIGYNGMPDGKEYNWNRTGEYKNTKYPYVIHAEINALLNATTSPEGAKLYVSLFPCSNCAKTIVQSGIKQVIYVDDKYHDIEDTKIAKIILKNSDVEIIKSKKINLTIT